MSHTIRSKPNLTYVTGALVRSRPGLFTLNVILWTLLHGMWLVPGLIVARLFDYLTAATQLDAAYWTLIAGLVGFGVANAIISFSAIASYTPWRAFIQGTLSLNMMRRILAQPGARALPMPPGAAVSRFRGDVQQIQWFVGDWTLDYVGIVGRGIVAIAIMYNINARITLGVVLPALVVILIAGAARDRLETYRTEARRTASRVVSFIGEMFGAVQAIKVNHARAGVVGQFALLNESRRHAAIRDSVFKEIITRSFVGTTEIGMGIVLLLAGAVIRDGQLSAGEFALFVSYMWMVSDGLSLFGQLFATWKQVNVSIDRIDTLLQGAPRETMVARQSVQLRAADTRSVPPLAQLSADEQLKTLAVEGLTYRHPDGSRGIEGISFLLARGSFTVVTGQIGAGKTTLLRCLLGLLPADAGVVRWNDAPIDDLASFMTPPRAAYTAQIPRLMSDTLRQNLLLGQPEAAVDLEAALHVAVMEHDITRLDKGLDTPVGPRGVRLSGGQVQRSAAARMLARHADLLIVDDLSSALDVKTEAALWRRLAALGGEKTVLAVSHRRPALQRADQIIVLENGRVADSGTLDELLPRSAAMRALWGE